MTKPAELKLWLYKHTITGISLKRVQTGDDTCETKVTFIADNKQAKTITWSHFEHRNLIDVSVSFDSIARLYSNHNDQAREWFAFKEEHKEDMDEYHRLKKKLGQ